MNNTTRRNLLAKLGVGAAAIAAMSVAGTSQTASAADLIPVDIKRAVNVSAVQQLQVTVAVSPLAKGVVVTSKASDQPLIGLNKDGTALNLAVKVDGSNVSITGLDSLINRNAMASNRCTITTGDIEVGLKSKTM